MGGSLASSRLVRIIGGVKPWSTKDVWWEFDFRLRVAKYTSPVKQLPNLFAPVPLPVPAKSSWAIEPRLGCRSFYLPILPYGKFWCNELDLVNPLRFRNHETLHYIRLKLATCLPDRIRIPQALLDPRPHVPSGVRDRTPNGSLATRSQGLLLEPVKQYGKPHRCQGKRLESLIKRLDMRDKEQWRRQERWRWRM